MKEEIAANALADIIEEYGLEETVADGLDMDFGGGALIKKALRAYANRVVSVPPTGWFSVLERNPERSGWYTVWTPRGDNRQYECVRKAYFRSLDKHWNWSSDPISHWTFMPNPPITTR